MDSIIINSRLEFTRLDPMDVYKPKNREKFVLIYSTHLPPQPTDYRIHILPIEHLRRIYEFLKLFPELLPLSIGFNIG